MDSCEDRLESGQRWVDFQLYRVDVRAPPEDLIGLGQRLLDLVSRRLRLGPIFGERPAASQGNLDKARGSFGEHDARLRFESLDVADENAVERAIDRCDTDFGPLVGLVNSAGIFGSETSALETDTGLSARSSKSI